MKQIKFYLVALLTLSLLGTSNIFAGGQKENDGASVEITEDKQNTPQYGGQINFVWTPLNTLDVSSTGSDPVMQVGIHIFETVLAIDKNNEPIPNLCTWEYQNNDKTLILHLVKGVKFHDGHEMDAQDVIASIRRWESKQGSLALKYLKDLTEVDNYTVKMEFTKASPLTLVGLAFHDGGCYVMEKSILEKAGDNPVTEYIGTGPYKLTEWAADRYIQLDRNEDYWNFEGEPNGYGGGKKAYADTLYWEVIKDNMTKVQAITSGKCNVGMFSANQIDMFENYKDLEYAPAGDNPVLTLTINVEEGVLSDVKMRQAVLAALDMDEIMFGSCGGNSDYYAINSSWGLGKWANDEGSNVYNHQDLDKAKQLMEEAGYNGEPIIFYGSTSTDTEKNGAQIITQQLKNAGFNVDLRITDWATVSQVRTDPSAFSMWINGYTVKPDPLMWPFVMDGWHGGWNSEAKNRLGDILLTEMDEEARIAAWNEMCKTIWEELPVIKIGDFYTPLVNEKNVENIPMDAPNRRFYWNTWISK